MLVDILSVILRALSFIALLQAVGVAIFLALLRQHLGAGAVSIGRLGRSFAWAAFVLVLADAAVEAGRIGGELAGVIDPAFLKMVLQSPTGLALAWRVLGLLLIGFGLRSSSLQGTMAALAGAVLTITAFTHLGHTSVHDERWALSTLLLAHLSIVAFWFGALLPLALVSLREPGPLAAQVVARFSAVAFWLVPILFLAGLLLSIALLPGPAALALPYGRLLLLKITGFASLMFLAALNKWRLGPALARDSRRGGVAFRRSVYAEYALITLILAVTALLTTLYSPEG